MLPAFGWHAVVTRWEFAPFVSAPVAVVAALYLWGTVRVARRHPARPWPWWRTATFLGGLAIVVIATQSGVGTYDDVLFWDHMVQHLLLLMVAPPMLVAGQPVTLLLHASRNPVHTWAKRVVRSRVVTFLTWPPFGLAAYVVTVVATHLTGLAHTIIVNQTLHNAEHVLYLVVGYIFFLPLIGREPIKWRLSYPIRMLVLVIAMPVDTLTGLVLGYQGSSFLEATNGPRPPGSPGPVADIHWAGAIMWIGGDAIMLGFIMIALWMWARDDQAASGGWLEAARKSSFEHLVASAPASTSASTALAEGATAGSGVPGSGVPGSGARAGRRRGESIDDDDHLAAYNEYLARLHRSSSGPDGG